MTESARIPLSRPDLSDLEIQEVTGVLRTPHLSLGPKLEEFEEAFAGFVGAPYAIGVANGTCALHLAIRAAGVRPGTEVITTPFTFVATANVLLYERARPVFVDVDPSTLNLTPEAVERTIVRDYVRRGDALLRRGSGARLAAILPVSIFGHPVDMDGFRVVADRHGLPIVHDACEGLGSRYWSARRGAWVSDAVEADVAVFAFYPNKQLTTGEGGMVVTADGAIARYCRMARNQGRREDAEWLEHAMLGFNYRMDEMSAALGVAQLRRADELLEKRHRVAAWYEDALKDIEEIERPRGASWARVTWFVYVVRVRAGVDRRRLMTALHDRGIAAKPYFPPVHLFPHLRRLGYRAGDFPTAEDAAARTIALPFFTTLSREQVDEVAHVLWEALTHVRV